MRTIILSIFIVLVTFSYATAFVSDTPAILSAEEKKAIALHEEWMGGNLPPVMSRNGRTSFVFGHAIPTIIVAPFKVAHLSLQPGEVINALVLGDSARWMADIIFSGSYGMITSHIVFKVLDSGLSTTAIITTDRRVYHIKLKSDPVKNMTYTGFIYPFENLVIAARAKEKLNIAEEKAREERTNEKGFDIANLNFNYSIKGNAPWRPLRVYDNGLKTYIQMSENMQEKPILLVKTSDGEGLVNYRVKNNTFIVDRLFEEAYLIVGVGRNQERITITRDDRP